MSSPRDDRSSFVHGTREVPDVSVESYHLKIRDEEGFVGGRASGRVVRAIFDEIRAKARGVGEDPFGSASSTDLK